jgi:hypothetical protein
MQSTYRRTPGLDRNRQHHRSMSANDSTNTLANILTMLLIAHAVVVFLGLLVKAL